MSKTNEPVAEWFAANIGKILAIGFLGIILYAISWIVVGVHFLVKWW